MIDLEKYGKPIPHALVLPERAYDDIRRIADADGLSIVPGETAPILQVLYDSFAQYVDAVPGLMDAPDPCPDEAAIELAGLVPIVDVASWKWDRGEQTKISSRIPRNIDRAFRLLTLGVLAKEEPEMLETVRRFPSSTVEVQDRWNSDLGKHEPKSIRVPNNAAWFIDYGKVNEKIAATRQDFTLAALSKYFSERATDRGFAARLVEVYDKDRKSVV